MRGDVGSRGPAQALVDAVDTAARVAGVASRLRAEHGLDDTAMMMAAHLVVRHGWGEREVLALSAEQREARHRELPHHDHGHGWD